MQPQLLIRRHECVGCRRCSQVCEQMTEEEKQTGCIIARACVACGKCMNTCPNYLRWICGEELTAEELAVRIRKNADEYSFMGGGVTFSGGEPLMQGEFLLKTMSLLPGIHKVVETSGYAQPEIFQRVFDEADLMLCDIKLMDNDLHKQYTGAGNEMILQNIEYMKKSGKGFIIRVPMIPDITDTENNLNAVRNFMSDADNLIRIEYLPYNSLAGAKYEWSNRKYSL